MISIRLAPLCGVTDHIYRSICFEQGCDQAYTEMISAMGYLCAPGQQATVELLKRGKSERKLILQLFGKDPDIISEAAGILSRRGLYDGIDLNMGCPARKVACSGEGCGLMKNPMIAEKIMKATVKASVLPVSVKMRLGWDKDHVNAIEFAHIAEDSGVSEIIVHGRTREQQYSGQADWDLIALIKKRVSIPVIGNGDIFTPVDAARRIAETGVDGIMIGRGALGNPWIFRDIKCFLSGRDPSYVSSEERFGMIRHHYDLMLKSRPEHIAVREMRKHIGWYLHGFRGAARARDEINRCSDYKRVFSILEAFFSGIEEA